MHRVLTAMWISLSHLVLSQVRVEVVSPAVECDVQAAGLGAGHDLMESKTGGHGPPLSFVRCGSLRRLQRCFVKPHREAAHGDCAGRFADVPHCLKAIGDPGV